VSSVRWMASAPQWARPGVSHGWSLGDASVAGVTRVLVAEDERLLANTLATGLRRGHSFCVAASAEELLERGWDQNTDPFSGAIKSTVSALHRRLGEAEVIDALRGAGYRLRSLSWGRP